MDYMNFTILFIISTLSFSSVLAQDHSCFTRYEESQYSYKVNVCDDAGELLSIREFFADSEKLSNESFYNKSGLVIKKIGHSTAGDFYVKFFEHLGDSVVETLYEKNSLTKIKQKTESNKLANKKTRFWKYEEGKLQWIDSFKIPNEKQIISREFIEEKVTYIFKYKDQSRYGDEVESFEIRDVNNDLIGNYSYEFDGDIESILFSQFKGHELSKKLAQFGDQDRVPFAIIDSGFDLSHPTITPFLMNHKEERWGEVDEDGNGLAGDIFGWSYNNLGTQSANINEPVIIGGFKPFPISHGTHVASIAMKGNIKASMIGFSGDVSQPKYLDIVSRELYEKGIRAANMSWGFKELGAPFTPPAASYEALKRLITNNPETLFHVAAGNNAWDLEGKYKDYPASYAYSNLFVIGSLNEDDYNWSDANNLKPALYKNNLGSNIGVVSVDAFAPGKDVDGARLGGGMIRKSGTSMASPYAMNSTIAVMLELPNYSALKIKELMLKTVGFGPKDLPCVSKGFIHPVRSLAVAKILKEIGTLTIEEAITRYNLSNKFLYKGEVTKTKSQLQTIWSAIDMSLAINRD